MENGRGIYLTREKAFTHKNKEWVDYHPGSRELTAPNQHKC